MVGRILQYFSETFMISCFMQFLFIKRDTFCQLLHEEKYFDVYGDSMTLSDLNPFFQSLYILVDVWIE